MSRDRLHKIIGANTSFSGADIVASITPVNGKPMVFGELQTISYSIHREKYPVRTLGRINPRGFCLPNTARVFIKDKGYLAIDQVMEGDQVQTSPSSFNTVLESFEQPEKDCYQILTRDGYSLEGSFDHPVMTSEGWKEIADLEVGDSVAVVGSTPINENKSEISDDVVKLLAYLIGDGGIHKYKKKNGSVEHKITITISNNELDTIGKEIDQILDRLDIGYKDYLREGCVDRRISVCTPGKAKTDWRLREYNELHKVLLETNLYGTYSHTKFIPNELISKISPRQIKIFLSRLFAADGCYYIEDKTSRLTASYVSTSLRLTQDVRLLLSMMGINCTVSKSRFPGDIGGRKSIISQHTAYKIQIRESLSLAKFISHIGIYSKGYKADRLFSKVIRKINNSYLDIPTKEFADKVREVIIRRNSGKRTNIGLKKITSKYNLCNYKKGVTPRRAYAVANYLGDKEMLAYVDTLTQQLINKQCGEYAFKPIKNKTYIGKKKTHNLTVDVTESFIANFMLVHNSMGPRTIAGSLIFTVFDRHIIQNAIREGFLDHYGDLYENIRSKAHRLITDEMPPFNVTISFLSEYNHASRIAIYGITIVDEGQVMSIDDIITENTMSYMATGIDLMNPTDREGNVIPTGIISGGTE